MIPPTPAVDLPEHLKSVFVDINLFVYHHMAKNDSSHDYQHVLRVLSNADRILKEEQIAGGVIKYDSSAIYLAALLHDVNDHKYITASEASVSQTYGLLQQCGAPNELADKIQVLTDHVGYTSEVKNPRAAAEALAKYPELGILQDADRLDAIGAVGVARCFAYGGAKCQGRTLASALDHFDEKLYKLPDMMKTKTGRRMAVERNKLLKDFAVQFRQEAALSFVFED